MTLENWERVFRQKADELYPASDPSHDSLHIVRVVATAKKLAVTEGAKLDVVVPAAYFHDFVNVPKNDPRRKEASRLSAQAAVDYLAAVGYPDAYFQDIAHAIEAHSFSAAIQPRTMEAKVVQDADRLDALGAVGVARCVSTSTLMQRPYYSVDDPWAQARILDDKLYMIDHFEIKLFRVAETLQTESAKQVAQTRVAFMRTFLEQLRQEIKA